MLTRKQYELLVYIQKRLNESGISPSFDEMKEALNLKSKNENALLKLTMETLKERRVKLLLKFAKSGIKHDKLNDLFPETEK